MIRVLSASMAVDCCAVKAMPSTIRRPVSIGPSCDFPAPVFLGTPEPAFRNPDINLPCQLGNGPRSCIVEGPIAANANSMCGPHIACSLPAQSSRTPITGAGLPACRGDVSPSTVVTPVNIQNAPEPPRQQQIGRAVPASGQVPGAVNVSIHANTTMAILVFGAIMVGFYFITR